MSRNYRTVVIGAGVVGVATAYFLACYGRSVVVIERDNACAGGASHANGGLLTPSLADPWNAPGVLGVLLQGLGKADAPLRLQARALPQLAGWGLAFVRHANATQFARTLRRNLILSDYSLKVLGQLRQRLALQYDQNLGGSLKVYSDRRALDVAGRRSDLLRDYGLTLRLLDRDGVRALAPGLDMSRIVGGVHVPSDESGDARAFTDALAAEAGRLGVVFRYGERVLGFGCSGNRIREVRTTRDVLGVSEVVVACGAWSPALVEDIGLPLPIQPVKGYSITLDAADWADPPTLPVVDDALHAAVTPLGARIRVAGTAEFAGFDRRIPVTRVEGLKRLLTRMYPQAADFVQTSRVSPWAGLRPVTSDGVPIIGSAGPRNLYLNTGHGHLGWTMAAGSGRLLADLICGLPTAIDPALFSLRRTAGP